MEPPVENEEFYQEFEAQAKAITVLNVGQENINNLGAQLHNLFSIYEGLRKNKEAEWLRSLRQFKKLYDPEVLARIPEKASKVYPGVTRSKVISARAKLNDICFPNSGKPWGLTPSPTSQLPPEVLADISKALVQKKLEAASIALVEQTGRVPKSPQDVANMVEPPTEAEIKLAVEEEARKRALAMEQEIYDQLVENNYLEILKKALDSGLLLGTGLVKGPLVKYKKNRGYVYVDGQWILNDEEEARPYIEFTRLWDWYPDMTVTEWEDAEGAFERHVMTKHQVRALGKKRGYDARAINEYLASHKDGDSVYKDWELKLMALANSNTEVAEISKGRKYEVLEWWGYVDGSDLAAAGVIIPEDMQERMEFEANVWLLGKTVIKATLNPRPRGDRPWSVFYFEKDDSSIFGTGLGAITRDAQITVAAAARMALDNAAKSAGPQIEINTDLIDPLQDLEDIFPWKIWVRMGRGQEANFPALRLHHMEMHLDELLLLVKQFLEFCDLETAIPTYMLIEPQRMGNETAQGASLRYSTTNITIRDIAQRWDAFMSSIIQGMYDWNMAFNAKDEIKGDYEVNVTGLSSLMAKELRAQLLAQTNSVLTESQRTWIKEKELLEEIWKAHDLPKYILRTDEEHEEYMKTTIDPRVYELQLKTLEAEVKKAEAQALGQLARAKKANVDAEEIAATSGLENIQPQGQPIYPTMRRRPRR